MTSTRVPALAAILASLAGAAACSPRAAPSLHGAAPSSPATVAWRIDRGRVGAVEIGERLPDVLLAGDLAARYQARYIADQQPIDTFAYEAPPILVILASGPFRALVETTGESGEPPTDALRGEAAAAARRGAKVELVMIRGSGPVTAAGIGVGSSLAALQTAYPDLQLRPMPETLGADTCRGSTKSLPGVQFMFASCDKARDGAAITRIDIWNPAG